MKSETLSKNGKKLVERLKRDHDITLPDDVVIRRTYAGHHQRSAGAMTWFFYSKTKPMRDDVGSSEKIVDLLKCKKITVYRAIFGLTELIIENGDYAEN